MGALVLVWKRLEWLTHEKVGMDSKYLEIEYLEKVSEIRPALAACCLSNSSPLFAEQQAAAELTKYPEHFPGADNVKGLLCSSRLAPKNYWEGPPKS